VRRRRAPSSGGSGVSGLVIGLIIGGAVLLLLAVVGVVLAFFVLGSSKSEPAQQAAAPVAAQQPVQIPVIPNRPEPKAPAPIPPMPFNPPPMPPQEPPEDPTPPSVALSNVKIDLAQFFPQVQLDFKFEKGTPILKMQFFLMVTAASGKTYEQLLAPILQKEGSLNQPILAMPKTEKGPFKIHLEMKKIELNSKRGSVSEKVTAKE
jgi:hypothetical protein